MPPTARWPLSCTMPRASAPFRNSPSSLESASVNGIFMRERSDLRTGFFERARVEEIVEEFRLGDVFLFNPGKAAQRFQPLEHEAGDVPGVGRRGVRHRAAFGVHFVVEHRGRMGYGGTEQVFAYDHDGQ